MIALLPALAAPHAQAKDPCKSVATHETAFGDTTRGRVVYVGVGRYLAVSLVENNGEREFRVMYDKKSKRLVDVAKCLAGNP